jgi:hypothetical protein
MYAPSRSVHVCCFVGAQHIFIVPCVVYAVCGEPLQVDMWGRVCARTMLLLCLGIFVPTDIWCSHFIQKLILEMEVQTVFVCVL